jgi:hypothetical protein
MGELVLEVRVGGEADVVNAGQGQGRGREKKHFCAAKGCVAGGVDEFALCVDEADAEGAFDLHVVAECAGEVNALEAAGPGADVVEE